MEVKEVMTRPSYEERMSFGVRVIPPPDIEAYLQQEETRLREDFVRNLKLALLKDGQILLKATMHLEEMTEREFEYWKRVRGFYTGATLADLERALAPEYADKDGTKVTTTVTVSVNEREVESEAARRAASKKLLDKFTVSTQVTLEQTEQASQLHERARIEDEAEVIDADYHEV